MSKITDIQTLLGVKADGSWGPISQAALDREAEAEHDRADANGWIKAVASTFADPDDIAAFKQCKSHGHSDEHCFAYGDNGIGWRGANTAQNETPMVAIHHEDMVSQWGGEDQANGQPVIVEVNGIQFSAEVRDRLGERGRIDLNPACCRVLKIAPGFLLPCRWRKA